MYVKLKIGWNRAKKKYFKEGEKSNTLLSFMTVEKKGSTRFRAVLTKNQRPEAEKNLGKMTQIKTFLKLTYSENISHSRLKSLIGGWDNSFLPGKIRTFLFKFYNNILGLNSRVAKFNVDTDPSCTFCSLQNHRPAEKETFAHLFFVCNTTNNIIREFFNRYFTIKPPNCKSFFCGNISVNEKTNKPFSLQWTFCVTIYG